MIKINTSTNTFRMTIALMKQIWGSGKPGPILYCYGGANLSKFWWKNYPSCYGSNLDMVWLYLIPIILNMEYNPGVSNVYAFLEAVNMDRHADSDKRISV